MALSDEALRELILQIQADQEAIRKEFREEREANLSALNRLNDTLTRVFLTGSSSNTPQPVNTPITGLTTTASNHSPNSSPVLAPTQRRATGGTLPRPRDFEAIPPRSVFSGITGDDSSSDSGDDESFFVQDALPEESFDDEGFREHLRSHIWNEESIKILGQLLSNKVLLNQPNAFQYDETNEKDHGNYAHGTVYDVGSDGSALLVRPGTESRSQAIWQSLRTTNIDRNKRQAVGRIAILREPSPLLFGAIHYTMKDHFDMDELFKLLSDSSGTKAYMKNAYEKDPRRQRSFVFCLKYYTIVGEDRQPLSWQDADSDLRSTRTHIPISTCSSVVALSLSGPPIRSIRSKSRRSELRVGQIYDPFAPYRVIQLQSFPDWKSTVDDHESNRHYLNGADTFLVTLITEYRDAVQRFRSINRRIVELATPPADFMFNPGLRDLLLFEDENYTFSRRYFFSMQVLAVMNDKIEDMISAYRTTFSDDVWTGKNKLLWPGEKEVSSKFNNWRNKMVRLRKEFEQQIKALEEVLSLNIKEIKDIKILRDQLFSGTSVLESRKSVEQTRITVMQGQNIKLLTLVSIFFLPLEFVSSLFGMQAMPENSTFIPFGVGILIVCLPTYLMIGSLNTHRGMRWWQNRIAVLYRQFLRICGFIFAKLIRSPTRAARFRRRSEEVAAELGRSATPDVPPREEEKDDGPPERQFGRSQTMTKTMAARSDVFRPPPSSRPSIYQAASDNAVSAPRPSFQNRHHRTSSIKFEDSASPRMSQANTLLSQPPQRHHTTDLTTNPPMTELETISQFRTTTSASDVVLPLNNLNNNNTTTHTSLTAAPKAVENLRSDTPPPPTTPSSASSMTVDSRRRRNTFISRAFSGRNGKSELPI